MYYITEKKSETGKKFQIILDKKAEVFEFQKKLANELGFHQWREGYWLVWGGFSCLMFKEKPDEKIYKKQDDGWMPKLNSKEGRAIQARLDACPAITIDELNQCIGFEGAPWKTIGVAWNNEEYFGIEVAEEWQVEMPADCREVTTTDYRDLFPVKS